MPLVSSVKDSSKLSKSLLVGGECLMFPDSHFLKKSKIKLPQKLKPCIRNTSLPRALHNLVGVNQIVDKNPLRIVSLTVKFKFSVQFN